MPLPEVRHAAPALRSRPLLRRWWGRGQIGRRMHLQHRYRAGLARSANRPPRPCATLYRGAPLLLQDSAFCRILPHITSCSWMFAYDVWTFLYLTDPYPGALPRASAALQREVIDRGDGCRALLAARQAAGAGPRARHRGATSKKEKPCPASPPRPSASTSLS